MIPSRKLVVARPDTDAAAIHLAGWSATRTRSCLTGNDTASVSASSDMFVPPGGGPPPHRHDFEETFSLLEGELDVTFRGAKSVLKAGETVNVPANAPHQFHNSSSKPARMLCVCAPAGMDEFFKEIGTPVVSRTAPRAETRRRLASRFPRQGRLSRRKVPHRISRARLKRTEFPAAKSVTAAYECQYSTRLR